MNVVMRNYDSRVPLSARIAWIDLFSERSFPGRVGFNFVSLKSD